MKNYETLLKDLKQNDQQNSAIYSALYYIGKAHDNAKAMVNLTPANKYLAEWEREEKDLADTLETFREMQEQLNQKRREIVKVLEPLTNELQRCLDNLSSAYQEEAISRLIEDIEYYDDMECFGNDACSTYRDILKGAGYGETTGRNSVYNGFKYYGDECEVQDIARQIFLLLKVDRQ